VCISDKRFQDENAVEAALLFNDKTFPPLLPRKLRVSRAKSVKRNDPKNGTSRNPKAAATDSRVPNRSMQGRARKLLGRAGATQLRRGEDKPNKRQKNEDKSIAPPESFIFEGHRARSNQGHAGFKLGGSGKRKGKPKTRSSKRGAAWKAARGKKDK
jgi:nucleolar protein 12